MVLAFVTCFMVFAMPVSAAPASKTFHIRLSSDYSDTYATITMKPSNSDGTKGTIKFNQTVIFSNSVSPYCTILQGTTYNYTIKKMKDGAEIKIDYKTGGIAEDLDLGGMKTMYGKIHIDGKAKFANIWKIDSFQVNNKNGTLFSGTNGTKWGIYFRNT